MGTITITYEGKKDNDFAAKDLSGVTKLRQATLAHDEAMGTKMLEWVRTHVVKPEFSAKLLAGKCNIKMEPNSVTNALVGKNSFFLKVKHKGQVEQAAKIDVEIEPDPNVWPANVTCAKAKHDVPEPFRSKIVEVADRGGSNSHGGVRLNTGVTCQHWVAGSTQRIFGDFSSGRLTVIGWGVHGNTDSDYNVELAAGGKTKGQTI